MATIHCPKCNAEISSLSLACPACQASLPSAGPMAAQHADPGTFWGNFWGVMTDTRSTFQWILDGPDGRHVWTLLWVMQLAELPGVWIEKGPLVALFMTLLGVPVGYLMLKLFAWLYSHIGAFLGGSGSPQALFKQVTWCLAGTVLVDLCNLSGKLFNSPLWHGVWVVVAFGVGIWGLIVNLITLSMAHRFSMWMAFWTIVLTVVLVGGVILAFLLLIGFFLGVHLL
ncbi:MAG TPA: hypothetical protein VHE12_00205 [bacterium]|nr:hypothetical protein [bacterium]